MSAGRTPHLQADGGRRYVRVPGTKSVIAGIAGYNADGGR